jgi:hypothetical protein
MNQRLLVIIHSFSTANDLRHAGLYPYFRIIESEQDTVVKIDGKPVLMFGSKKSKH